MVSYKVLLKKSAEKDLRRIEKSKIKSLIEAIENLEKNPRPEGCKKLVGSNNSYRIRVGGYRIVYLVDAAVTVVEVERVRHRKDVYR